MSDEAMGAYAEAIASEIRRAAKRIPPAGTVIVRGGNPIDAQNFAEACARVVEDIGHGRWVYHRLCDQPPRVDEGGTT